ncbi:MAG: methylmalonyl-CoA mutase [Actinomycetota bacterium]|nr:methylmalonyl-CoA mutase family protein [Actinomycetota bacterium]
MSEVGDEQIFTDSGIPIKPYYEAGDIAQADAGAHGAKPGEFPYTRGIYPSMYRGRLWTFRQYSGFGTANKTNERFKFLLDRGQTGLSVAFDLPTQMGLDPDHPRADGEVGGTGVAISSLADMEVLFEGIPLDKVSTSMTINATAAVLLLLYEIVAEKQGVAATEITGTVQNDILKEYAARGTYIYPPKPSMRIITDLFAYCAKNVPKWNTISISGYHIREAGSTAVQEVAFTMANAIAYVQSAIDAGLAIDDFAPRLSFFFACHMNFFEEIAKFRAARRLWASIAKERFNAIDPKSQLLRFHTQTGGATLTAQQPENNIVRTAYEAMAAVLGGTQSLHTNGFDEALSLPTERAAKLALRTQQVLGYETGVASTADPLGGSWFVESLTEEIENKAKELIALIDDMGGAVEAIERGWMKEQIEESAYRIQLGIEDGSRPIVGVNTFDEQEQPVEIYRPDPDLQRAQIESLNKVKASRDSSAVTKCLDDLRDAARGDDNLLYPMRKALSEYATIGEVSDVLRQEFGMYQPRSS